MLARPSLDCLLVLSCILWTVGKAVCELIVDSALHLVDCWKGRLWTACMFDPASYGWLVRPSVDYLSVQSCILLTVVKAIYGLLVGSVLHLVDCCQVFL